MTQRLIIDSRCRRADDTPDRYTIDLVHPIKGERVSLVTSNVPLTAPTVSEGCDTFLFAPSSAPIGTWTRTIKIARGRMQDDAALATAVQTAFDASEPAAAPTVAVDAAGHLVFETNTPFRLAAGSSGSARLLGLAPVPIAGENESVAPSSDSVPVGARHSITAQFRIDREPETYLVLGLDIAGSLSSPVQATAGATAIVRSGWYDVAHPVACATIRRELTRIRVTFTRADGTRYDFDGADHVLEFDID